VDLCGPLPLFLFQCGGTMGENTDFRVNDPVFSRRSATEPFTVLFPFFFAIPVLWKTPESGDSEFSKKLLVLT
jgi:hypothetical protein